VEGVRDVSEGRLLGRLECRSAACFTCPRASQPIRYGAPTCSGILVGTGAKYSCLKTITATSCGQWQRSSLGSITGRSCTRRRLVALGAHPAPYAMFVSCVTSFRIGARFGGDRSSLATRHFSQHFFKRNAHLVH
jgi:hypothetical protein